jgi:hypothetical protein
MSTPEEFDKGKFLHKMHILNTKVMSDPSKTGETLKDFYIEQVSCGDEFTAELALIVRSIDEARASQTMNVFDHTKHLEAATPLLKLALSLAGFFGIACIAAGIFAIYKNSQAATTVSILGASLSTNSIGIGAIFFGVVALVWPIKWIVKRTAAPAGR